MGDKMAENRTIPNGMTVKEMEEDLDRMHRAWKIRMERKRAEEDREMAQQVEKQRQDYLRRTGRTEMKP